MCVGGVSILPRHLTQNAPRGLYEALSTYSSCFVQMRGYLIRKLLLGGRKYSQNEGIAARKQANRVLLDRNDVQDLKYFLEASNCTFSTAVRGSAGSYTPSEVRQLFKAEPFQIGAFWAELSMDSKDAAYGAILGAFVGDAAGGVLEFLEPEEVTPENVRETLPHDSCHCLAAKPMPRQWLCSLSFCHSCHRVHRAQNIRWR